MDDLEVLCAALIKTVSECNVCLYIAFCVKNFELLS